MKNLRKIAYTSLFAALICASAFICIPTSTPFTMQVFSIFLAILSLGASKAFYAVLIYISIGMVGLPVFSGLQGGFGAILSPNGGFILGFLIMPIIFALSHRVFKLTPFCSGIISLLPLYLLGVIWFILISGMGFTRESLMTSSLTCVLPFVIPDIIKLALAIFIHKKIKGWIRL